MGLRPEEQRAGDLLSHIIGGRVVPVDVIQDGQSRHDLNVELGDAIQAVEVTRAIDQHRRRRDSALTRQETSWPRAGAGGRTWWLATTPTAHVAQLRRQAEDFVQQLEDLGLERWSIQEYHQPEMTEKGLRRHPVDVTGRTLGVQFATSGEADEPNIVVTAGTEGGTSNPEPLVAGAEREADANAEKLDKALRDGCSRTHLFIWVESWSLRYTLGHDEFARARQPELPDGVHELWLVGIAATGHGPSDIYAIWHWDGVAWTSQRHPSTDL